MAAQTQIDELYSVTDTTNADFAPQTVSSMIDTKGFNAAVASIWRSKAAKYAALVDVSESGSSRSMSQLYKNAITQAEHYEALAAAEFVIVQPASARPRTRPIERV